MKYFLPLPIFFLLFGWAGQAFGQTSLSVGDLAIIGIRTDNPDDFTFVTLVDLEPNTVIYFTDKKVTSEGASTLNTGEGVIAYTAPTAIHAGTVVSFVASSDFSSVSGSFSLAADNDAIIAFQGFESATSTVTTFLHIAGEGANEVGLPAGLTAQHVVAHPNDNNEYSGKRTGNKEELFTAINTAANWASGSNSGFNLSTSGFIVTGSSILEIIMQEDFEDAAVHYTATPSECGESMGDNQDRFFTRISDTFGTNEAYELAGEEGTFYFAAMDTNTGVCNESGEEDAQRDLTFTIDIRKKENLKLAFLVGEDEANDNGEDWDNNSSFYVQYRIDGGEYTEVFRLEAAADAPEDANGGGQEPRIDSDGDGEGDGVEITDAFNEFVLTLSGTGTTLEVVMNFDFLNQSEEDLAIDNVRVFGQDTPPALSTAFTDIETQFGGMREIDLSSVFDGNSLTYQVISNSNAETVNAQIDGPLLTLGLEKLGNSTLTVEASNSAGSISDSFEVTVVKADQEITFLLTEPENGEVLVGETFTVSATSSVFGATGVTYSVISSIGEAVENTIDQFKSETFGTVRIQADIPSTDPNYNDATAFLEVSVKRPVITLDGTVSFFSFEMEDQGTQTYRVAGNFLTDDITITPPSELEISLSENSGFSQDPIILTAVNNAVESTPVFVRIKNELDFGNGPTVETTYQIEHTTAFAVSQQATVSVLVCNSLAGACLQVTTINSSSVRLNWITPANAPLENFQIIGGTSIPLNTSNPTGNPVFIDGIPSNATSWLIEGLEAGTQYYFQVRFTNPGTASSDLYFSEYAEGSGDNKYLEIFNPTAQTIDLSNYAFPNVTNGPTTFGEYESWNTFPHGASIAPGEVYVIADGRADPIILAQADHTFNSLSNGDDGFALAKGGTWLDSNSDGDIDAGEMTDFTLVDFIGDWNADPGSGWNVAGVSIGTKEHTLVRKPNVSNGNINWTASAGTNATDSEWIVLEQDDWTDLGMHTVD